MAFASFYFDDDVAQETTNVFAKSPRTLYEEYKQATAAKAQQQQHQQQRGGPSSVLSGGATNPSVTAGTVGVGVGASGPTVLGGPLPAAAPDGAMYHSTCLMLKKTRAEVEAYGRDLGAVSAIADLQVSADVRRTVARLFADPRNAEAISDAEWRRRELEHRMDRDLFNSKIDLHLLRERDSLQRELSSLPAAKTEAKKE